MINEQEEKDQDFILGPVVFGSLYEKWFKKKTGYKAKLLKIAEENPNLKTEIDQSISTTEKLLKKYLEALNNWKTAARIAKKTYDDKSDLKGKVKNFFGFDSGKQDDKMFGPLDRNAKPWVFTPHPPVRELRIYSIKDILSMDFNIGLAHPDGPKKGQALKTEVQQMVAFTKYFNKKKTGSAAGDEKEKEEKDESDLQNLKDKITNIEFEESHNFFLTLINSQGLEELKTNLQESQTEEQMDKLQLLKQNAKKDWDKYIEKIKETNASELSYRILVENFLNCIDSHWFVYLYYRHNKPMTLSKYFEEYKKKYSEKTGRSDPFVPNFDKLKNQIDIYFTDLNYDELDNIDQNKITEVFGGGTPPPGEEEALTQDEKEVKEVIDKLQEASPVFERGATRSAYTDKGSPWYNWAIKHKRLLNFLASFHHDGNFVQLTSDDKEELPKLYALKMEHIEAQLKAYGKYAKDQGLSDTFNKGTNPEKLLQLHRRYYIDIDKARGKLNYSEQEEEESRTYDIDAFAKEINSEISNTLTADDLQLLKLLKFKERESLQESNETRTEMNKFLALTNFKDLENEQKIKLAQVLAKIDDKFIEKLKKAIPGYPAWIVDFTNKEFEKFTADIRSKLFLSDYNEQLEQLQKGIPLFVENREGLIKDIHSAFYDPKSIVRKFLDEKEMGKRVDYKNYIYPFFNALKKKDTKLLKKRYDVLIKAYDPDRIDPEKAQEMLLKEIDNILSLLSELVDAKHQEMLRDLQALTKYYEEQKKFDRVKVINQKIKENKVSEVYKIFYNFINDNKEELLKYFENNDQELSTPEKPKEKTEDEILKEKLEAVVGTKIKDKGEIVFIAEFHKDEKGKYKMGPTADSLPGAATFYKNVFDNLDGNSREEDKLFLLRYKKEGEEFNYNLVENGQIITEKEFLNLYKKTDSASDTQEKDLEEQKIEKLDFKDSGGREFFIINTKKYGKIAYYTSSGTNTPGLSVKGTPVPFIGIVYTPNIHPTWFYKFNSSSGPEGITFEKNPLENNDSPQDEDFKNYRSQVAKLMEKEKTQIYSIDKINDFQDNLFGHDHLTWWKKMNKTDKTSFLKYIPFAIKLNRTLKEKGALREDFMRTTKYPLWGIDDIIIGDFVISKDVSILDTGDRAMELSQFINKLKNLNSLNEIAEEYIKLFKKLGGERKNLFPKEEYIEGMKIGKYQVFSRLGFTDKFRNLIKERANEIINSQKNTQEQLVKLIKPLIREKLKRKQNGKKNLRN